MGRIESNRPRLLAPAFARDPIAGQARVEQGPGRKDVGALVHRFTAIDFGRGVAVVEDRFGLKLVIVGDVIEADDLDSAASIVGQRIGTDVVKPQRALVQKSDRLAELNRDIERLALAHLYPAGTAR